MSTTTTNFGLIKPELTDVADITAMNENWDKIDNLTPEDIGAVQSDTFETISPNTTILNTIKELCNKGHYCGRFYSNDNVTDNPEENWGFGIEYYKSGSLIFVTANKAFHSVYYKRQINTNSWAYITSWEDTSGDFHADGRTAMNKGSDITFQTQSTGGVNAVGTKFLDDSGKVVGGIGAFAENGELKKLYMGVGVEYWSDDVGLAITSDNIYFKGTSLLNATTRLAPATVEPKGV